MCTSLILISGYCRTGKDRLYDILAQRPVPQQFKWRIYKDPNNPKNTFDLSHNYTRVSFADLLKLEAAHQYGIPEVVSDDEKDIKQFKHYVTGELVSARDIYIEWGAIRRDQDPNYWCKLAIDQLRGWKTGVVTDWRFLNEVKYALNTCSQVVTVRIYRSEIVEPPLHIRSEHELDGYRADFLLVRDDPEEFIKAVQRFPQYRGYVPGDTL